MTFLVHSTCCLVLPFVLPLTIPLQVCHFGTIFIVSFTNYFQGSPWLMFFLGSHCLSSFHVLLLGPFGLINFKQVRMFPTICCFMHPDQLNKSSARVSIYLCSRFYLKKFCFMEVFFTQVVLHKSNCHFFTHNF